MLHSCLSLVRTELNSYIKARAGVDEGKVVLANLGELFAAKERQAENKLIMSLVDIAKEEWSHTNQEYLPQPSGGYITRNQPVTCSVYILFSAYFKTEQVLEGLKYLSLVIAFFQAKNYFNTENTPLLQQLMHLDNLSVELVELGYQEKQALWHRIGAPYMPSVLYKVGTISIEDTEDTGVKIPEIKDVMIQ